MKVFVYGTLMRGYSNHHVLGASRFLGTGETLARCKLYHAGFPVLREGGDAPVLGEVFEVTDAAVLHNLDCLEGEGRMYFRRVKLIRLFNGFGEEVVKASVYVGHNRQWHFAHRPLYPLGSNGRYYWPEGRKALFYGDAR